MTNFEYIVIDKVGKEKKGSMEAQDSESVKAALKSEGFIPLSVKEQNLLNKDLNFSIGKAVKARDMSIFCRQFNSILSAGVTIISALNMLSQQTENKALKGALREVQASVEKGETLAGSMAAQPKIFPDILIHMVEAGEASGSLETSFERMAIHFEKDAKLKGLMKQAMIYPIAVCIVAVIVVIVMMTTIIPQFTEMFADLDTGLPAITLFVMGVSDFIISKWWLLMLIAAAVVFGIVTLKKTDAGKVLFGKLGLKAPLFGTLTQKTACARLARTLSTLMASGMPLISALDITAKIMDNEIIKRSLQAAREEVSRGVPLSQPLEASGIFPPLVYHMTQIGEETGNMESMLNKIADYYDEEVEIATKSLAAAMEPLVIVILALIIGVIVMAVMMPMMGLYGAADPS